MSKTIQARFRVERSAFTLDVDLQLPGQGITALFGHSGSARPPCARHGRPGTDARRLLRAARRVWQDEARAFSAPHRRALGVVFQEAGLFPTCRCAATWNSASACRHASARLSPEMAELLGIAPCWSAGRSSFRRRTPACCHRPRPARGTASPADGRTAGALDLKRKLEILPYLERLHRELAISVIYVSHAPG